MPRPGQTATEKGCITAGSPDPLCQAHEVACALGFVRWCLVVLVPKKSPQALKGAKGGSWLQHLPSTDSVWDYCKSSFRRSSIAKVLCLGLSLGPAITSWFVTHEGSHAMPMTSYDPSFGYYGCQNRTLGYFWVWSRTSRVPVSALLICILRVEYPITISPSPSD